MSEIDIRDARTSQTTSIKFSDETHNSTNVAHKISTSSSYKGVLVGDRNDFVIISDKEHAKNLIKALNKAIELGWLK